MKSVCLQEDEVQHCASVFYSWRGIKNEWDWNMCAYMCVSHDRYGLGSGRAMMWTRCGLDAVLYPLQGERSLCVHVCMLVHAERQHWLQFQCNFASHQPHLAEQGYCTGLRWAHASNDWNINHTDCTQPVLCQGPAIGKYWYHYSYLKAVSDNLCYYGGSLWPKPCRCTCCLFLLV